MTRFEARPVTAHPADIDAAQVAQGLVDNLPAHVAAAAERADDPVSVVREWLFSGGLQDPERKASMTPTSESAHEYAACEIRGPNLIVARRCLECGELARTAEGYLIGRLPDLCRTEHGNQSVEITAVVNDAP